MQNKLKHIPSLTELAGEWKDKDWLAHLPSVRNQLGQALVNKDLTSISWLASPPLACGYHTGVLSVNGKVWLSDDFRWYPYQALRRCRIDTLVVETATRMLFDEHGVVWRVTVSNEGVNEQSVDIRLDCMALVSKQEDNWGWLYGQPWKNGIRHDFFTAESQRSSIGDPKSHQFMLSDNIRPIVIGSNVPVRDSGNLDDDDDTPMMCETELPMHTTPSGKPQPKKSFVGAVKDLEIRDAVADDPAILKGKIVLDHLAEIELRDQDAGMVVGDLVLPKNTTIRLSARPLQENDTGYVLSHGNQPESLQLSLQRGCLRLDLGGDFVELTDPLPVGDWSAIAITFDGENAKLYVDGIIAGMTSAWWDTAQWHSSVLPNGSLTVDDSGTAAAACFAYATEPNSLDTKGSGGEAGWTMTLAPGESRTIDYVLCYGQKAAEVQSRAAEIAENFDAEYEKIEAQWEKRWLDMFSPETEFFDGHLPILDTDDEKLKRVYYMSPLNLLYMLRTGMPVNDKVYLSGGPRLGPTVTFLWDTQGFSAMYALLNPAGLKDWIRNILKHDVATFFALDNYGDYTIGNRYVANSFSMFRLIYDYVSITGDKDFLNENVGDKTVLLLMEGFATEWQHLTTAETGGKLADFGPDHWDLLECVTNYKHVVVSFNAGYVSMNRKLAEIYSEIGESDKAAHLRQSADSLASAILELYAGDGHWLTRHPDGDQVVHHCLDFQSVAAAMHADLPEDIKNEMIGFVRDELLTDTWMRAQSLLDPMAGVSDRPDHGAYGAFDGWPGETSLGLSKLGAYEMSLDFLRSIYPVTYESTWSQAHEFIGGDSSRHAEVRIAERGSNCRDSMAGGTIGESFIRGVFQYEPEYASPNDQLPLAITDMQTEFTGTLFNVRYRGDSYDIHCKNGKLSTSLSTADYRIDIK